MTRARAVRCTVPATTCTGHRADLGDLEDVAHLGRAQHALLFLGLEQAALAASISSIAS